MNFYLGFRFPLDDREVFEECKNWCNSSTNYYIDEVGGMYEVLPQAEVPVKEALVQEKALLLDWLRKHDYVGTKIATGRASQEEYADVISEMTKKANRVDEINSELETL